MEIKKTFPRFLVNPSYYERIHDFSDCIIIGSGIAGLSTAIRLSNHIKVKIFTKSSLSESNTWYAQGGIAAAIKNPDNWKKHYEDTMVSGQGLCDSKAVKTLVKSAPEMIENLIEDGVAFDIVNGEIGLTLEGGHSSPRILHAGGDATGEEIEKKLIIYSKKINNIEFYLENFVLDILTSDDSVCGIIVLNSATGKIEIHPCSNIVISTGGIGQLYKITTNPVVSTGDGIAMSYRAGAEIKDIEFIQFHPTVFRTNDDKLFLITEALRGEGAFLRDTDGNRFMIGRHPLAELAPRDIVVKEMTIVMKKNRKDYVFLDATHIDKHLLNIRFPNIVKKLKENGLDLKKDLIKVSPAAHYLNGGIKTTLDGETNIRGLFACGETAATGAHGANRLASNSLMEGLVFGTRIYNRILKNIKDRNPSGNNRNSSAESEDFIKVIKKIIISEESKQQEGFYGADNKAELKKQKTAVSDDSAGKEVTDRIREKLRYFMTSRVGILREKERLEKVLVFADEHLENQSFYNRTDIETNELLNMFFVARLIIVSALLREESRGTHQRCDFPQTNDNNWKKHIIQKKNDIYFEPVN
ncbi:MAG TPA: L-aspartate oxidase [Actinobacteria bacterium]|nr:L-aspartate oxidase [Actinomycetota bacterium]